MDKKLSDIFNNIGLVIDQEDEHFFKDAELADKISINRKKNKATVKIRVKDLLPIRLIDSLEKAFKNNDFMELKLVIEIQDSIKISNNIFFEYFNFIKEKKSTINYSALKTIDDKNFKFDELTSKIYLTATSETNKTELLKDLHYYLTKLKQYGLKNVDYQVEVKHIDYQEIYKKRTESLEAQVKEAKQKEQVQPQHKLKQYTARRSNYGNVSWDSPTYDKLLDLEDNAQNIIIHAMVMNKDIKLSRSGRKIYSIDVTDNTSSIKVTYFAKDQSTNIFDDLTEDEANSDIANELRSQRANVGDWVAFKGRTSWSNYDREQIFVADNFKKIEKKTFKRKDNSKQKRVELHAHTKMSVMDGVSTGADYIKRADEWGWNAIAFTDHLNVQAFPEIFAAANAVNKKRDKDNQLKIIYGSEMNVVEDSVWYSKNNKGQDLKTAKFCIFDLETTGLSPEFDEIIEFGATTYDYTTGSRTGQDILIKPKKPLKQFTKELTHITDEMLEDKPGIEEAFKEIYKAIDGAILVAHNANFDFDFLQSYAKKLGYPPLTNTVIDTLTIARAFWPHLKNHRLGTVSKKLGILYDDKVAHRGDYDADVLTDVFERMWTEIKKVYPVYKDTDWDLITPKDHREDANFVRNRGHHLSVIAKNQAGLKELYKLISKSHTDDFFGSPKILKSHLIEARKTGNLLFGSGCVNGEIFDSARTDTTETIREHIKFYDFVEIQPLSVYKNLVQNDSITEEQLKTVIKLIIKIAKEENKPVVATSDAHYTDPDLKIIREVYINAKGLGGANHPLYDYKGKVKDYPDQYLRTTDEMLEEFSWLGNQDLVKEIILENSNKIADLIDDGIIPVKSGSYPPVIENSSEMLKDKCYETAHEMYGEELPKIVSDRLELELGSIIKHGFSVIYWISHKLVERSLSDGYLVGSRGSVGSSFVATMSNITEVNPLKPHYRCPNCKYSEWDTPKEYACGFDLPPKNCPKCQTKMIGDGHDIPFQTFLGFDGDKVPDIDLNFSGEYQPKAHNFTKEMFGDKNVFRAGTISTVAEKTAFGYVTGYFERTRGEFEQPRRVEKERLARLAEGVKRTTGQHPGGIVILPSEYEIEDFTPVNYPADDIKAPWLTTHFDFHSIHDNLLKMDILGHVDPTALRMLRDLTGIDPMHIPTNDKAVYSLFDGVEALGISPEQINNESTGALGIPEFGTDFVRGMLRETKPKTFADLVQISGLSHGTDVWLGNARDLIKEGKASISTVIGCRDDIMVYLLSKGMPNVESFTIMESVRKGKGLKKEWIKLMLEHNVPEWYIDSCLKIKYMFPKAHATAYVLMAYRVAWYKIHYPAEYYATYYTTRADAFDLKTSLGGYDAVLQRLREIEYKMNHKLDVSKKEEDLKTVFEIEVEMFARGIKMGNIDFNKSLATKFIVDIDEKTGEKIIIPPFNIVDSLGEAVANSIVEARARKKFTSENDLKARTQITFNQMKLFEELNVTDSLSNDEQISFDF